MAKNITPRAKDFSKWYQDIINAADMSDQAPVRGCVVFKPNGFAVWEAVQAILDQKFKATGHQNAYFPLLIPESFLNKEKEHIEGFAPELAVVTHAGGKKLEEPLVVRPTSEAIIGHMYAKWIKSYRDLPVLINQWCNVMRWELRPRVFLRTSEFLWQEGHTAHETSSQAAEETAKILKVYQDFIINDCLIPCYTGAKPAHEKFPGAEKTFTLEGLMQDGKALQLGTSHNLGQNFAKVFEIKYLSRDNKQEYVWTTSWGVSTRIIGSIIMVHADDEGLVLPPNLAQHQLVIVPLMKDASEKKQFDEYIEKILKIVSRIIPSWKIKIDNNYELRAAERFFYWEQRGVPLRLEIGLNEIKTDKLTISRRDQRTKELIDLADISSSISSLLADINKSMFAKAEKFLKANTFRVDSYQEFKNILDKKGGFIYAHWDGTLETANKIKEETKATIRVLPAELEVEKGKCIYSGKESKRRVLFAAAY